jgi:hypothetical protein
MTTKPRLFTSLASCGLAALITGVAHSDPVFCIAVDGGFGSGGTSFIARNFTVPGPGVCVPWTGFTRTAGTVILFTSGTGCLSSTGEVLTVSVSSQDPAYLGAGRLGSDYIQLCPTGAKGCALSHGSDQGTFGGSAKEETCTGTLLHLPPTHD